MYYKFLNKEDVDRVLIDGTIKISSLDYLRKLEQGTGYIADPLEGSSVLTFREGVTLTEGDPGLHKLNASGIRFAEIQGAGKIMIIPGANITFAIQNVFVFSYSSISTSDDFDKIKRLMREKEGYDACVRIRNPMKVARKSLDNGHARELGDSRIDRYFSGFDCRHVTYISRSVDFAHSAALAPDPFTKEERFSWQAEERLIFRICDGVKLDETRLTLAIPDPRRHFEVVDVD